MLQHWYDWVVFLLILFMLLGVFRSFLGYLFYTKAILDELKGIRKLLEGWDE